MKQSVKSIFTHVQTRRRPSASGLSGQIRERRESPAQRGGVSLAININKIMQLNNALQGNRTLRSASREGCRDRERRKSVEFGMERIFAQSRSLRSRRRAKPDSDAVMRESCGWASDSMDSKRLRFQPAPRSVLSPAAPPARCANDVPPPFPPRRAMPRSHCCPNSRRYGPGPNGAPAGRRSAKRPAAKQMRATNPRGRCGQMRRIAESSRRMKAAVSDGMASSRSGASELGYDGREVDVLVDVFSGQASFVQDDDAIRDLDGFI